MPASIERLRTRPDRIKQADAARLRDLVVAFPGLPPDVVSSFCAAIDRMTASENGWDFMLIGPVQNAAVVQWLRANSALPLVGVVLWSECFARVRRDTQEIVATREELAMAVGAPANDVSRVMSELVSIKAISRRVERVPGMRGRGRVTYYMNPWIGTSLPGAARDAAQASSPKLAVVSG